MAGQSAWLRGRQVKSKQERAARVEKLVKMALTEPIQLQARAVLDWATHSRMASWAICEA